MIHYYSKFIVIETCFQKRRIFENWTISPHFHQSNGLVKQSIQTVKHTLKRSKISK